MALAPIGINKSRSRAPSDRQLYADIGAAGIEVLLDARNERPGVMFADLELIGIHIVS